MREHLTVTDEDLAVAATEEKKRGHDVMAHVYTFGRVAPAAVCRPKLLFDWTFRLGNTDSVDL